MRGRAGEASGSGKLRCNPGYIWAAELAFVTLHVTFGDYLDILVQVDGSLRVVRYCHHRRGIPATHQRARLPESLISQKRPPRRTTLKSVAHWRCLKQMSSFVFRGMTTPNTRTCCDFISGMADGDAQTAMRVGSNYGRRGASEVNHCGDHV